MATSLHFDIMSASGSYAEAVRQAAALLVAMSFKPNLQLALLGKVFKAVQFRGGSIGDHLLLRHDLSAALDDVTRTTAKILSTALRIKLPGIADEIDEAFVNQLRNLLDTIVAPLPTM